MAIQGLRDTSDFVTDEREGAWRKGILHLFPNGNVPLTALTNKMKKRSVTDPQFNWWEKVRDSRRLKLNASTGTLTTTTTLFKFATGEDATGYKDGDCFYVEATGEIVIINGDPSTALSCTMTRGAQGSTAAAYTAGAASLSPNLMYLGSMNEEGSLAPTGISGIPTKVYNYTQIFRDTLEMTRTASKTKLRTGDQIKEAKRETLEQHAQGMERAFFFNGRVETTKNGKPMRSAGGVYYYVNAYNSASNIKNALTDYASGVTMKGLEEYLRLIFEYGSSEKLAFCGNIALKTIQQIVRLNSSMQIFSGIKEFGMNVMRLETPFGTLVLKNHPMFNEVTGGLTATSSNYYGMNAWMFVLDMTNIGYTYLEGSDTKYQTDLQVSGMDGLQSGFITEAGLEVQHPRTHFIIKNLVGAAADS